MALAGFLVAAPLPQISSSAEARVTVHIEIGPGYGSRPLPGRISCKSIGEKLWYVYAMDQAAPRVSDQGLFYVALTAMIIGVQLFTMGFVAELVRRYSPERNVYRVTENVGL